MKTVVLDFETYYDTQYSLKRMTTEEYVRDPRFKIHCVAVISSDGTRVVFKNNFAANLAPYMDAFVIAQHAHFDGLILSHHLNLYPRYWGCTLSMARAVLQTLRSHSLESLAKYYGYKEKQIDYNAFRGVRDLPPETMDMLMSGCLHDAQLTYDIAQRLLAEIPPQELQIIDLTIRMFTEPCLQIDAPRLSKFLQETKDRKEKVLADLKVDRETLHSSKKLAALLESVGAQVPLKYSVKTEKYIPALAKTDEGMKELLESENETVAALASARLEIKSTLLETRCERLLAINERGAVPVYLKYYGAHTGRWSGGDKINFQNFTRGSELRKSVIAPDGYKLVWVDASQIECRLLNWFSGQYDIVEAFASGRDIYSELATKIFERPISKKDEEERGFGKETELASGYGMGWMKLQNRVFQKTGKKITDEGAQRAIEIYRATHPQVCRLWRECDKILKGMYLGNQKPYDYKCLRIDGKKIFFPDGTWLDYTGLSYKDGEYSLGESKMWGGVVTENIMQKLGRIITANAIIGVDELYGYKLVTTTHDDIIYAVPEQDDKALGRITEQMKVVPEWGEGLPLNAEGGEGKFFDK